MKTKFDTQGTYDKNLNELQTLIAAYNKLNAEMQNAQRKLQEIALDIARKEAIVNELAPFVDTKQETTTDTAEDPEKAFEGAVPA